MEIHSGYAAADVVGRSLFDLYPDLTARGTRGVLRRGARRAHHRHFPRPAPLRSADAADERRPARSPDAAERPHRSVLRRPRVIGTVTILEDVSDRVASEAELRTQVEAQQLARATAERALRAKDEFLSTLSHEMRTPLNAVLGWARFCLSARRRGRRTARARALHVIERNASAQAKMIDDMLDMARIVAGKLRLEMQPVDLVSVVLAAVDVVMPAATAKQIAVRTRMDPQHAAGARRSGSAAADGVEPAVERREVHGIGRDDRGGLAAVGTIGALIVSDTGQGISPEFLPYVFDRFRQNDSSSARRHGGLGLGLALVRELVELHGGTVTAASDGRTRAPRSPSTCRPRWRRRCFAPDLSASDAPDEIAPSLAGVRVLVVDDEPDARELSVRALEQSGASVTAVSSSAAALVELRSFAPTRCRTSSSRTSGCRGRTATT